MAGDRSSARRAAGEEPPYVDVFFAYSPKDEALRDELAAHLAALRREGILREWHDGRIGAGEDWRAEHDKNLESARLILLLVSADFLASDFCYEVQVRRALERQRAGEALVVPILLRKCDWSGAPFAGLSALPADGRPVKSWPDKDEAWDNVVRGIRAAIQRLRSSPRASSSSEAAPPRAPARPVPAYDDARSRELCEEIERAVARRDKLKEKGFETASVAREIVELRRKLREGGQLRPGDSLAEGRYLLLEQIGRGGFAVVWKAHDGERGEVVAVKVLHANLAGDSQRRERFFRGARIMSELEHEAVVRVLERRAEDGGFYYFIMEFLPGGDLRQAVIGGRVTGAQVIPIILRVGAALAIGHARGIVHRDIKPTNILLDASGAAKLTDFDLVHAADSTGGTRTGALGTFVYAAPEVMDRPQDVDPRADVFSLGMTVLFGLYGRDLPMAVIYGRAERLINTLACPSPVKEVLKRAVKIEDIGARYEDAAKLCEALAAAVEAGEEAGAPRAIKKQRPRASKALPPSAGTGAKPRAKPTAAKKAEARGAAVHAVQFSPQGDCIATGHSDGTVRLWETSTGKAIRALSGHTGVQSVAFSPDGGTLASGSEDGEVVVWNVGDGECERVLKGRSGAVRSVAFSPDGRTLASGSSDGKVIVWGALHGERMNVVETHLDGVLSVAFSPNGRAFATAMKNGAVGVWPITTGLGTRASEMDYPILRVHTGAVFDIAFNPSGKVIASASEDKTVRLWRASDGHLYRVLEGHTQTVVSVAWSPDGVVIASASLDRTIRVWKASSGRLLREIKGHAGPVLCVAWSPSGYALVSGSQDMTARVWSSENGTELRVLEGAQQRRVELHIVGDQQLRSEKPDWSD